MKGTASKLEGITGGHDAGQLEAMGLGGTEDQLKLGAAKLRNRARRIERQAEERAKREEEAAEQASLRSQGQYYTSTTAANEKNATRRARAQAQAQAVASAQAQAAMGHAQGRQVLDALRQQGYVFGSETAYGVRGGKQTRSETFTGSKEENGQILTRKLRFDFEDGKAAGARLTELSRAMKETRNEAGLLGGDFIRNTAKVMTWAASVRVMQAAMGGLEFSLHSLIDIGPQMARLDQTFKGVGGNSHQLTMDILALASAEGRGREEAMEAAIQWSRLGLTRVQVAEATRASLMAANIAQISSGEATEHLSAIYNAYGLHVGQLRVKLSELNSMALQFNVTNAEMLQGLSRSTAVAKQARLPMEELSGMIAVMVGTTGQSGANMGNAMKTLMSKLSNPGMQQRLQDQFRLEVKTDGGNEIKGMSQMLADVYVQYQKMSDAQRQSLLYMTAGATQTARITALLDNYIRAQTLSITAQLQLNSAEQEDVKIKATLKSQLQGIVTEWERFINLQANKGGVASPMSVLTATGEGLHNALKVINEPHVSNFAAAAIPMLVVLGARMTLTKIAMEEAAGKSNILMRSFQRLRATGSELGATLTHVIQAFSQQSTNGNWFDKRLSGVTMGLMRAGDKRKDFAQTIRNKMAPTTLRTAVPNLALESWARLNSLVGRTLRLVAGVTVAMRSFFAFGVEMAVIGAGIWAFNKAMDYAGLSSERAEAKLAGFNAEAERAEAAGNAAAQAFRLFETAQRALPNMRTSEDRIRLWEQMATVAFPEESNSKDKPKTDAFRNAGMDALRNENGLVKAGTMLQERKLAMIREEQIQRQLNFEALKREEAENQKEIDRLKGKNANRSIFKLDNEIKEREARQEMLKGKVVENLRAQASSENDYEEVLAGDQLHLNNLAKMKTAMQAISELYREMHGVTAADRYGIDLEAKKAELAWTVESRAQVADNLKNNFNRHGEEEVAKTKIDAEVTKRRTQLTGLDEAISKKLQTAAQNPRWGGEMPDVSFESAAKDKLNQEIDALEAGKATMEQKRSVPEIRNIKLDETLKDQEQRQRADVNSMESADYRRMVERQTRMDLARHAVDNQIAGADYGVNEGDRLRRKFEKAGQIYQDQKAVSNDPGVREEERLRALGEAQAALLAKEGLRLEMQREMAHLQAQEKQLIIDKVREFQRGMMMSGPGELLRKMAAFRLTGNGQRDPSSGQFFAMGSEMRGDVLGIRPGMDPAVQMNRRAQEALAPFVQGVEKLEQAMLADANDMRSLVGQLSAFMKGPTELLDASGKVGIGFMELVKSTGLVSSAMERLEGAIGKVEGLLNGVAGHGAAPIPLNPQTAGFGGGGGMVEMKGHRG